MQDEYGTAAYKTVELDTFLYDKSVQHREVEGNESILFKSYLDKLMYVAFSRENITNKQVAFIRREWATEHKHMVLLWSNLRF